jgi:hypothetical protein
MIHPIAPPHFATFSWRAPLAHFRFGYSIIVLPSEQVHSMPIPTQGGRRMLQAS